MNKFLLLTLSIAVALLLGVATRRKSIEMKPKTAHFTPILDKQKQLDRWKWRDNHDDDWFKSHIPFWESPDSAIDATYYYRWELATKHMIYGSPHSGYSFSEFIDRPSWSGAYGSISCPLGLQLSEVRWLRDPTIATDYARYWFHTPGAQPRSYSNWFGSAVWKTYLVNNDRNFIRQMLPDMEKQYAGWIAERWDKEHQMFHWSGMHDGMETNIASRQTQDQFQGGDSYRPTLNSYVYGDLIAIANVAALEGDAVKARAYRDKAQALKARVQDELWDKKREFFIGQFAHDEEKDGFIIKAKTLIYQDGKYQRDAHGRELSGFVPWQFDLPDKNGGYEVAWKTIVDTEKFLAPYGLYFTEKNDPLFLIAPSSCVWSGNNWPYANAQVLEGMANVLNNYPQKVIDKNDYFRVLQAYTKGCVKDGQPYLAETSDPNTGKWTQDVPNSSDHYFHSSYNDLIITGLVGLRPRADNLVEVNPLAPDNWDYFALDDLNYHGQRLSIIWDKTGARYNRGRGLSVWANGQKIASSPTLKKLQGALPNLEIAPTPRRMVNFAVNNDGAYFPRLRASFTGEGSPGNLNDGNFYYHDIRPLNRWTTQGSPHAQDSIELDFGIERPLQSLKLYLLDDGADQAVRAPAKFAAEFWNGQNWQPIPNQTRTPQTPVGHRPNIVQFPLLNTSRVRVVLEPQAGTALGLSEIEAWGDATLPLTQPAPADNLARSATPSASFTSKFDSIGEINDGQIVMNGGRNRWTAFESPNARDWLQLSWPQKVTIARLELALWADNDGIRAPKSYAFQWWDGQNWQDVKEIERSPTKPTLRVPNETRIEPVNIDKIRVIFEHAAPKFSGVSEWMVWEK